MTFSKMQWLFPIALTLHNAEEAMWMPTWDAQHAAQLPIHPPSAIKLRILLFVLTAGAFGVTSLSARRGRESVWAYLLFGSILTMLINVLVPHVPAAFIFHSYAPGLITAVLINLPLTSWLTWLALRDGWVSGKKAIAFGAGVPIFLAALIVTIFMMEGVLTGY